MKHIGSVPFRTVWTLTRYIWQKLNVKSCAVATRFKEHIVNICNASFSRIFHGSSFVMALANYIIFDSSLPPAFCNFKKNCEVGISGRLKRLSRHLHTLQLSVLHRHNWMHLQYLWFELFECVFVTMSNSTKVVLSSGEVCGAQRGRNVSAASPSVKETPGKFFSACLRNFTA